MNTKTIVLFDMDGTLTPARKPAENFLKDHLIRLSKVSEIGILTGSDLDYLLQQCQNLWNDHDGCMPDNITLMPCNGTKVYKFDKEKDDWALISENNMRSHLGSESLDGLMKILIAAQYAHISKDPKHPLTGHFVCYRGSMINWSPVGRNADNEQRKKFVDYDLETGCRVRLMAGVEALTKRTIKPEITFALGGNTSVDIYPAGWDKTFALNHLKDYDCWFVGDRCEPSGNDYQIYEKLKDNHRSFKTTGPEETAEIIEKIISIIAS